MKDYNVLLYYIYSTVEDPSAYRDEHHLFCIENDLLGRVIVSKEGLNGTVSGRAENCRKYMDYVRSDSRFSATEFKVEDVDGHVFNKLHVRIKDEIVNSDLPVDPTIETGLYVEPEEFKKLVADPDAVLVDMRSSYEHSVGRFKGAVTFDMDNLRELPDHIDEIEHLRNKKIITYCTGGIKCEKASAYLLKRGFQNVYQLHGGIIRYGLEQGGEDFEGKCYVFDNRITTDVNRINPKVISKCYACGEACDRMVNCANPECNRHVALCTDCGDRLDGACSPDCSAHPDKRLYDGTGNYPVRSNHYHPVQGFNSMKRKV